MFGLEYGDRVIYRDVYTRAGTRDAKQDRGLSLTNQGARSADGQQSQTAIIIVIISIIFSVIIRVVIIIRC